ncbi:MAG: endolytic transglycosylase MltG [Halieaceae bacterium]|nr:endolytic transglycosylase MltG [Halieaceae bacterium]
MKTFLLTLVLAALLLVGLGSFAVWQWWQEPITPPNTILLVDSGDSLSDVAVELEQLGALRWPDLWTVAARLQGLDASIKVGEYWLDRARTPGEVLAMLVAGDVRQYDVTVPEGLSLAEALDVLQQNPAIEALLDGTRDARLLALIAPYTHPEGLFFPDTYRFVRGQTDLEILTVAHRRMLTVLEDAWGQHDPGLPYDDAYQALIMASIVEKETGMAAERDRIAGVFVRRLQNNMRLQTDPTVIYGLGQDYTGNLRRKHLDDESNPYNTYRHRGLPPTPIALPGEAAIRAALNPADGSELYFVARGDGSHQFSSTLEEHNAAVRRYQLRRREDYRSAPPPARQPQDTIDE